MAHQQYRVLVLIERLHVQDVRADGVEERAIAGMPDIAPPSSDAALWLTLARRPSTGAVHST